MATKSQTFMLAFLFIAIASTCCLKTMGDNQQSSIESKFLYYFFVKCKYVSINYGVGAKLYAPLYSSPSEKLPLVVYYHGGGFSLGSTFLPPYDDFLQSIVLHTNVIILSVEYRLSEFNPLPTAYDDSWSALQWVASHHNGSSSEEWLTQADTNNVFLAGDSAGANIAHNMAMRFGSERINDLKIKGIALLCPFFWGSKPVGLEPWGPTRVPIAGVWLVSTRGLMGLDDVRINPLVDPKLPAIGCNQVLVIVGELDFLYYRGVLYARALREKGYQGNVELLSFCGFHDFFLNLPLAIHRLRVLSSLSLFFNNDS